MNSKAISATQFVNRELNLGNENFFKWKRIEKKKEKKSVLHIVETSVI